ncbi:MAG: response regulator [Ignavibacteria bacterium]|nr:response regulator [Ignavibacteria bacterium]
MKNEVKIIIAEDDEGHATLIEKNLRRSGILNETIWFKDGQETLDYLFQKNKKVKRESGDSLLLLLDIRMPKLDGTEVLQRVKEDKELRKMPVIMITTTDDPREVEKCHDLGCSSYLTKPIDYDKFVEVIRKLGLFLLVVEVPTINGKN